MTPYRIISRRTGELHGYSEARAVIERQEWVGANINQQLQKSASQEMTLGLFV
jgi:hypothetical protein